MNNEIKTLLEQAISTMYVNIIVEDYNFDTQDENYSIELTHTTGNRTIRIGCRDVGRKRNFDIIPINAINAPLGLIEIFTTFLAVFWDAHNKNQTMLESLAEMIEEDTDFLDLNLTEEKLVQ